MNAERIVCVNCGREGHRSNACPMRAAGESASSLPACMGGWCGRRSVCPHFLATDRREPSERLCLPGADGVGADLPIRIWRNAGSWERGSGGLLARANALAIGG